MQLLLDFFVFMTKSAQCSSCTVRPFNQELKLRFLNWLEKGAASTLPRYHQIKRLKFLN